MQFRACLLNGSPQLTNILKSLCDGSCCDALLPIAHPLPGLMLNYGGFKTRDECTTRGCSKCEASSASRSETGYTATALQPPTTMCCKVFYLSFSVEELSLSLCFLPPPLLQFISRDASMLIHPSARL